ncbi:MAG: NAD(P)/FAD-dependent oxidoreductase [Phycisphaerales bacterium]
MSHGASEVQSNIDPHAAARQEWDALVIGAGPAGSVAAYALARAGRSVLLVDRAMMPRAKVCGCCMAPRGVHALERAGLRAALVGASAHDQCTIYAGLGHATLPTPGYRVLGRDVLDARLAAAARDAGAALLLGVNARVAPDGNVRLSCTEHAQPEALARARAIVSADGLGGTSLAERSEFSWRVKRNARMGLGATLARSPVPLAQGHIALLCGAAGYLGLVRLPGGEIDAAAALDPVAVRAAGGPGRLCEAIVAACGGNADVLRDAAWRGTPLLTRSRSRVEIGSIFIVGDAAGYVEPFTGEGMAWAIEGSIHAAATIHAWLADPSTAGAWARTHARLVARQHQRSRLVAGLVRSQRLTRALVVVAGWWPRAGSLAAGLLGPERVPDAQGAPA